jgi:hydrogenase nickel incorporation protein HypA/HybF
MHELAITEEVVALARERARGARVRRLVLEIGKLTAVLPDAVRACFDVCAEGTELEGAVLEIVETDGRARCRACGRELVLDRPFGRCACGQSDLEWLSGEELVVREMEVEPGVRDVRL